MTIQDLKDNKKQIISFITDNFGIEFVELGMEKMLYDIEFTSASNIEVFLNDFKDSFPDQIHEINKPRKEGKLASMMAKAHEDERYNMMTKDWEKI